MEHKLTVSICDVDYTLRAEESPAYMQKVADMVDERIRSVLSAGRMGRGDAAVLAAMNLADELLKQQESANQLRSQLKDYLDDATRTRNELSDCRRELNRLRLQVQRNNQ